MDPLVVTPRKKLFTMHVTDITVYWLLVWLWVTMVQDVLLHQLYLLFHYLNHW